MHKKYLLLMAIAALALSTLACGVTIEGLDARVIGEQLDGSGDVEEEERDVSDFDSVVLAGVGKLIIEVGDEE